MRDAFSDALVRLAVQDPKVLLLTGDHGYALFDAFRNQCPAQYINAGIAEQNMVGMAAGLARAGFRPFVYGLSAFVPLRVLEQIKLDIAHDGLPVVLLGDGAGFVYSHLGTSHQSTEDIACTRVIAGLDVLSPADRHEMTACMAHAYAARRPVYLRMGKSDRGDVHSSSLAPLEAGRMIQVRAGQLDLPAFIATGSMVRTALDIAEQQVDAGVWSVPSIKPLDAAQVVRVARDSRGVVVLEEHSTYGGLGSAIAEIVGEHNPVRVMRIGVSDRFSEHCGTYSYLLKEHGLDHDCVLERIRMFIGSTPA
ncbi:transketolase [Ideonella azotifigens]|uniref:Transketolase family protein n=1 Tax=Ideonella azotifigens TaxID=513160 RepID=A0ABN1K0Q6_9BURK|nr:transketolase C-terminal domain-containing protein [Ideonella azotifigens]MCD2341580.1 transketolase [Ideonella azotifigens]